MKKVLIITTHFAPSRHIGAKRPIKFAKFLPEYGWHPLVLTNDIKYYHNIDDTLNQNLSSDLNIYHVKKLHMLSLWRRKKLKRTHMHSNLERKKTLKGIMRNIFFYDYTWLIPAFFVALRTIQKKKVDIIFSTSPPAEPHLLALILKVFTRKKWVCDFRDPWTKLPACVYYPSPVQKKVDRYLERIVLNLSDYILCASDRLRYELCGGSNSIFMKKSSTIYNGYDKSDFDKSVVCRDRKFTMTYLGTWGHHTTPDTLLKALGRLKLRIVDFYEQVKVNLVGEIKFDPELQQRVERKIAEYGLNGIVNLMSFRSHREALSMLGSSDILLLVVGIPVDEPESMHYRVPAKFFEYLYVRKPILALVPPEGEAARIIRQTKSGVVVSPTDVQAIEEAILDLYLNYREGKLISNIDQAAIEQFDRRKEVRQLAQLLNLLLKDRTES